MREIYLVLIALLLILPNTSAINFGETIKINGTGELRTETDTSTAQDLANGYGSQNYSRTLISQEDPITSTKIYNLYSTYDLTKNANVPYKYYSVRPQKYDSSSKNGSELLNKVKINDYNPSRYMFRAIFPSGLQHVVNYEGNSSSNSGTFYADARVEYKIPVAGSTSFTPDGATSVDINGDGKISEFVTNYGGVHNGNIIESTIFGNASLSSTLSDTFTLGEVSAALSGLEKVKSSSSTGRNEVGETKLNNLLDYLERGLMDSETFLNEISDLWEAERITRDAYAECLKKAEEKKLISENQYNSSMNNLASHDSVTSKVKTLKESLKKGLIDGNNFKNSLGALWNSSQIDDDAYTQALNFALENGNITQVDYNFGENRIKSRIKLKWILENWHNDPRGVWGDKEVYKDLLRGNLKRNILSNKMYVDDLDRSLRLGQINQTDYDEMIQELKAI